MLPGFCLDRPPRFFYPRPTKERPKICLGRGICALEDTLLSETCLKVRTYECDSHGHVNNAVYLNYLEHGRMEALNQRGFSLGGLRQKGFLIVVRRVEIDYKAPAREGDQLVIRTYLKAHSKMKGVFTQEILRPSGQTSIAKADVTWAFLDLEGKPRPIPDFFQEAFGF
jgi:acyl-CoA thioester hydrolase